MNATILLAELATAPAADPIALAPLPELAFALQLGSAGAAVGAAIALRAKQRWAGLASTPGGSRPRGQRLAWWSGSWPPASAPSSGQAETSSSSCRTSAQFAPLGYGRHVLAPGDPTRRADPRRALLTADDVARVLRVPRSTVYEYARRLHRPLPAMRIGRHLRFYRSEIEAWLLEQRGAAAVS